MNDRSATTFRTYAANAFDYLNRHRDRSRMAPILRNFASKLPPGSVLDLGCGPGFEINCASGATWSLDSTPQNKRSASPPKTTRVHMRVLTYGPCRSAAVLRVSGLARHFCTSNPPNLLTPCGRCVSDWFPTGSCG